MRLRRLGELVKFETVAGYLFCYHLPSLNLHSCRHRDTLTADIAHAYRSTTHLFVPVVVDFGVNTLVFGHCKIEMFRHLDYASSNKGDRLHHGD